ncbi:hypothetical protein [Actinotalea subterranea]|uniref:hypothetical protein n=1 Tax=Actinotalea subterranea TaxID=2607497 RepID=UPI00165E1980|nr:hypothetical protein [Actinotalea subterranea]
MQDRLDAVVAWVGEAGTGQLIAVAAVCVLVLALVRARGRRGRARPAPGEVWFAEVPFEDGTGSKDRPVLVLAVRGGRCSVARFTSQDRSARGDHRRVPGVVPGLQRSSWANLRPITLRRRAFRRRVAPPDAALVAWYEREADRLAAG